VPTFSSDGVEIAYESYGDGRPILLIHGFASNGRVNWVDTGWVDVLTDAGYRAITIDNRGHGHSEKLYDPAQYPARTMARDAVRLLDHLELPDAIFMGYSMGGRISAFAAIEQPERVNTLIIGGMGINLVHGLGGNDRIIAGLSADSLEDVTDELGRQFRRFAEHTKSDLKALAACMGSSREKITEDDVRKIACPTLVAVGSNDVTGGDPEELAALIPNGESLVIEGRDHMRATGDKQFKDGVLAFLARQNH